MFSRTHKFIFANNIGLICILAFLMLAFIACTLWGQPWMAFDGAWEATPPGFWYRFMPMAQFAATASLAYLALEMFRHVVHVEAIVRELFKAPTAEERKGLVASVGAITRDEEPQHLQLILMISLFRLAEVRRLWVKGGMTEVAQSGLGLCEKSLKEERKSANKEAWFREEVGATFLKCFLVGRDIVVVLFSLMLAVWIHFLATVEASIQLYAPPVIIHIVGQLMITSLMCAAVSAPLYYVFVGRKLLDEIQKIADLGKDQYEARKRHLEAADTSNVQEASEMLRQMQPADQAAA